MIRCVCLVDMRGDYLRLVQVRHRDKMYFPGGKIEPDETLENALIRELHEELQLELKADDLEFIGKIVGEAYPQKNELTELNGFKTTFPIECDKVAIDAEITDIGWVHKNDQARIAPAVCTWIDTFG